MIGFFFFGLFSVRRTNTPRTTHLCMLLHGNYPSELHNLKSVTTAQVDVNGRNLKSATAAQLDSGRINSLPRQQQLSQLI
jgi:hypothetical protein